MRALLQGQLSAREVQLHPGLAAFFHSSHAHLLLARHRLTLGHHDERLHGGAAGTQRQPGPSVVVWGLRGSRRAAGDAGWHGEVAGLIPAAGGAPRDTNTCKHSVRGIPCEASH